MIEERLRDLVENGELRKENESFFVATSGLAAGQVRRANASIGKLIARAARFAGKPGKAAPRTIPVAARGLEPVTLAGLPPQERALAYLRKSSRAGASQKAIRQAQDVFR